MTFFISNSQAENFNSKHGNASIGDQNSNFCKAQGHLILDYENQVKEMRILVEEQKEMIHHCGKTSHYFGRQGEEIESKDLALLRKYERGIVVNMSKANSLRVTSWEQEKCVHHSAEKLDTINPLQFEVAEN